MTTDRADWRDHAACLHADPDLLAAMWTAPHAELSALRIVS